MRSWVIVRTGAMFLTLLGSLARTQEPLFPSQDTLLAAPRPTSPALLSPTPLPNPSEKPLLAAGCPFNCGGGGSIFDIDAMLGMLMGIRGQVAVYRNPNHAVVVEGFYGALLDRLATSEGAGAGGRYYFRRTDGTGCNSVLIGPGAGAYCHFHQNLWMVAPTTDVAWVRAIGDQAAWQIGLNAGLGVGVASNRDSTNVGRVTPLLSLFTGFRF